MLLLCSSMIALAASGEALVVDKSCQVANKSLPSSTISLSAVLLAHQPGQSVALGAASRGGPGAHEAATGTECQDADWDIMLLASADVLAHAARRLGLRSPRTKANDS